MDEWIIPGRIIGVIGDDVDALYFTQAALRMGYQVYVYNEDEMSMAGSISDEHWIGSLTDHEQLKNFAQHVNCLVYTSKNIGNEMIRMMMNETYVPQGDEILSLAQDKALQKITFDSLNINVAPYSTVLSKEDVKEAVELTGYPAVITNNFSQDYDYTRAVIRNEEDIDELSDEMLGRTCIQESFIEVQKELNITVAVDVGGHVHPVALCETKYDEGQLKSTMNPPEVEDQLALEAYRITYQIAESFDYIGILSLDFIISDSGILYVKEVTPFTTSAGLTTLDAQNLCQYELFVRTAVNWSIPEIEHYEASLSLPFYSGQFEKVVELLNNYPTGKVYYYNETKASHPFGHITFNSEDKHEIQEIRDRLYF